MAGRLRLASELHGACVAIAGDRALGMTAGHYQAERRQNNRHENSTNHGKPPRKKLKHPLIADRPARPVVASASNGRIVSDPSGQIPWSFLPYDD